MSKESGFIEVIGGLLILVGIIAGVVFLARAGLDYKASAPVRLENDHAACFAESKGVKRALILNGGFRQQTGEVINSEYEAGVCYMKIKMDKSGAIIKVKNNNYEKVEA